MPGRKREVENCPFVHFPFRPDPTAMTVNDVLHDGEPRADLFPSYSNFLYFHNVKLESGNFYIKKIFACFIYCLNI